MLACGENWVRGITGYLGGGVLGIDEMIILSRSARNGSSLDWDDFSLDEDLCQAVVTIIVNH